MSNPFSDGPPENSAWTKPMLCIGWPYPETPAIIDVSRARSSIG